jgi:Tfp pilus assembly protein PilX
MIRFGALRGRLADAEGFVLVSVMIVLLILGLLVSAAVVTAVGASHLALNDVNDVRAQQAADAGLREATFEYNLSALDIFSISTLQGQVGNCVTGTTATGIGVATQSTSASPPWCAAVIQDLGDSESYSYQSSPATQIVHQTGVTQTGCILFICTGPDIITYSTELERIIVSTGTAGNVTRRVAARINMIGTDTTETCGGLVGCLLGAVLNLLGVNPGASGTTTGALITQSYASEPNSYRQCLSSAPSGSDPSSNCSLGPTGIS